jgi:hypothetical protein
VTLLLLLLLGRLGGTAVVIGSNPPHFAPLAKREQF